MLDLALALVLLGGLLYVAGRAITHFYPRSVTFTHQAYLADGSQVVIGVVFFCRPGIYEDLHAAVCASITHWCSQRNWRDVVTDTPGLASYASAHRGIRKLHITSVAPIGKLKMPPDQPIEDLLSGIERELENNVRDLAALERVKTRCEEDYPNLTTRPSFKRDLDRIFERARRRIIGSD